MTNSTYHKRSLARFIFNYFSKKYGNGHFFHGHIRHKIDFVEQEINFNGLKLRFCMFMQDDATTYLTVFDDSQKSERSQGKILLLTSALFYEKKRPKEVQHFYRDCLPTAAFIAEIDILLKEHPIFLVKKRSRSFRRWFKILRLNFLSFLSKKGLFY